MNYSPEPVDSEPVEEPGGLAAQLAAGQAALAHAQEQASAPRRTPRRGRTKLKHQDAPATNHTADDDAGSPAGKATVPVPTEVTEVVPAPLAEPPSPPRPEPELKPEPELELEPETAELPATAAGASSRDDAVRTPVVPADDEDDTVVIAPIPGIGDSASGAQDVVALVTGLADRARAAEQDAAGARAELHELKAAITTITTGAPGSDRVPGPEGSPPRRRRRVVPVIAGGAVCAAVALTAWGLAARTDPGTALQPHPSPTATSAVSTPTSNPDPVPSTEPAPAEPEDPDAAAQAQAQAAADQAAIDQAAAEAAEAAERSARDRAERAAAAQPSTAEQPAQVTQEAPAAAPVRATYAQSVNCTAAATVTFTATGGGQVDLSADGRTSSGNGSATLEVQGGPGTISATSVGDDWTTITFTWVAVGGICS
ncbi:hypothetical protein [Cellulomonas sp. RIT-PI-Y]|uniref:hypothetical protein n=1 Tax=Cellulomonas sp. RIT-PI-Y TaxID=3035297 RepID=UPI0021D8FF77|nr:hypothetical protein [Cellulomonas sp. RIT-PI-Y]